MANTVVFRTVEEVKNAFVDGKLYKHLRYLAEDEIYTGVELFEIIHNSSYPYDEFIDIPFTEIED